MSGDSQRDDTPISIRNVEPRYHAVTKKRAPSTPTQLSLRGTVVMASMGILGAAFGKLAFVAMEIGLSWATLGNALLSAYVGAIAMGGLVMAFLWSILKPAGMLSKSGALVHLLSTTHLQREEIHTASKQADRNWTRKLHRHFGLAVAITLSIGAAIGCSFVPNQGFEEGLAASATAGMLLGLAIVIMILTVRTQLVRIDSI
jgi:hypothetical protein